MFILKNIYLHSYPAIYIHVHTLHMVPIISFEEKNHNWFSLEWIMGFWKFPQVQIFLLSLLNRSTKPVIFYGYMLKYIYSGLYKLKTFACSSVPNTLKRNH